MASTLCITSLRMDNASAEIAATKNCLSAACEAHRTLNYISLYPRWPSTPSFAAHTKSPSFYPIFIPSLLPKTSTSFKYSQNPNPQTLNPNRGSTRSTLSLPKTQRQTRHLGGLQLSQRAPGAGVQLVIAQRSHHILQLGCFGLGSKVGVLTHRPRRNQ